MTGEDRSPAGEGLSKREGQEERVCACACVRRVRRGPMFKRRQLSKLARRMRARSLTGGRDDHLHRRRRGGCGGC
eukprot:4605224-Pleurochrysis_carterae.AAC.2